MSPSLSHSACRSSFAGESGAESSVAAVAAAGPGRGKPDLEAAAAVCRPGPGRVQVGLRPNLKGVRAVPGPRGLKTLRPDRRRDAASGHTDGVTA